MKNIIKNITHLSFAIAVLFGLGGCESEETLVDAVDLRFFADSSYEIVSTNPDALQLQVRSLYHDWVVYGKNPDWTTITPSEGLNEETFDVSIQYTNNDDLEIRVDTIYIQSDYWIGKKIVVTQLGNGYLNYGSVESVDFDTDAEQKEIEIFSNQNWSAKVVEGEDWFSIISDDTGSMDGTIKVECEDNYGEIRTAVVALYDRNGDESIRLDCIQAGVVFEVDPVGNIDVTSEEQPLTISVTSNTRWTISKLDSSEGEDWFTQPEIKEYDGDDELVIDFKQNDGGDRSVSFTLSTIVEDGVEPIVRTINITQKEKVLPIVVLGSGDYFSSTYGNLEKIPLINTIDPVTFTFTGSPVYIVATRAVRLYSGNTVTITSDKTIISVVVVSVADNLSGDGYASGVWTGSSNSVVLNADKNTNIQYITVTYDD